MVVLGTLLAAVHAPCVVMGGLCGATLEHFVEMLFLSRYQGGPLP